MSWWGTATSRGRPVGSAIASLVLLVTVTPGNATAAPNTEPPAKSVACAQPPAGAPTAAERDRFVGLWLPRVADQKFLRTWFETDGVPADIRAEGFHSLDPAIVSWLTSCLVDAVIEQSGVDDQPAGTQPAAQRRTEIDGLTSMFVFRKEELSALRDRVEEPVTVPRPQPPQPGIEARIDRHPAPARPKVVLAGDDAPTAAKKLPGKVKPATLAIGVEVEVDLGKLIDQLIQDIGTVTARLLSSPPLDVIGGLTYRVCAQSAQRPLACSIPLPVGVPTPVAANGGLVPDMLVNLSPVLDLLHPADLTVKLSAKRLFPNAGPLAAHVFAVYDPPFTNRRVQYGYDGRNSTLADSSSTSVTLHNAFAAVAGDVRLSYAVNHDDPGSTGALTFAVKRLRDNGLLRPRVEQDPTAGAISFSPVPSSVTGTVRLNRRSGADEDTITLNTNTRSHVDASFSQDLTSTTPKVHRQITASIDKLPSSLSLNLKHEGAVERIDYRASGPIDRLAVSGVSTPDTSKPTISDQASFGLTGLPAEVTAVVDTGANSVEWTGSAPTTSVDARVHLVSGVPRPYDVNATVAGIPASWRGGYTKGQARFEGLSGPIGTIDLSLTNHGEFDTLPGDHLHVNNDDASGDLDASFHAVALTKAEFSRTASGFSTDLNLGNRGDFAIGVHLGLDGRRLDVTGTVHGLPQALHLAVADGNFIYSGDGHPTLQFSAGYGTPAGLATTAAPAQVHGLSVRDGVDAVKANLFLTGAPDRLDFDTDAGVYKVNGFAPTVDPLVLDADLRHLVGTPLKLLVTQNVGTGSPVDFTFGSLDASRAGDGTATTSLHYAASRAMGALNAEAILGADHATFAAGAVPSSIDATVVIGPVNRTVTVQTGSPFGSLDATYRRTGESEFAARVGLTDLPTSVALKLGSTSGQSGDDQATLPTFDYSANAAGLNGVVSVRAALFGAPASANVEWTKLGSRVIGNLEETTLKLTSSPATGSIQIDAAGFLSIRKSLDFDAGPLENTGFIAARIDITDLHLKVTELANLTVEAGFSTAIIGGAGDYGEFEFSETSETRLDLHDHLDLDLGVGTWDDFIAIDFDDKNIGNAIVKFRMATNDLGEWFGAFTPIPCLGLPPFYEVQMELQPRPRGTTDGPSLRVSGASAAGSPRAWVATPIVVDFLGDPTEPLYGSFVADIIARFTTPLGGDQGFDMDCGG